MSKERLIKRFYADNSDGKQVRLSEWQVFTQIETTSGLHELPGIKRIKLDNGNPVNWNGKGQYKIVLTGELLTSDDPDAP